MTAIRMPELAWRTNFSSHCFTSDGGATTEHARALTEGGWLISRPYNAIYRRAHALLASERHSSGHAALTQTTALQVPSNRLVKPANKSTSTRGFITLHPGLSEALQASEISLTGLPWWTQEILESVIVKDCFQEYLWESASIVHPHIFLMFRLFSKEFFSQKTFTNRYMYMCVWWGG